MTRRSIVYALLVTVLVPAAARAGTPERSGPSLAAQQALLALEQPSLPQALPGSTQSGTGTGFSVAESCSAAQAAYKRPGAPLPRGAKVSAGPGGGLLVTTRYGQTAIFFSGAGGNCSYTIDADNTVSVTGHGPIPAGGSFATVGCQDAFSVPSAGTEGAAVTLGGRPYFLLVGDLSGAGSGKAPPPAADYRALVAQGSIARVRAELTSTSDVASIGKTYSVSLSTSTSGQIVAELGGAARGETLSFTCTSSLEQLLGVR